MDMAIKRGANGYRIGDSHHRSEFTDHEIELMRRLRDARHKVDDIAAWFGATKGYVSKVCSYRIRRGGR
jgi:hypothetical protein